MDIKKETKEYLNFVRSHPCMVCSEARVDADHLQARGIGGASKHKGTHTGTLLDFSVVPLCRIHHTERHSIGTKSFQEKYKVSLWREAFMLLRSWYVE